MFNKLFNFFSNLWKFRKVLWNHRNYDYMYSLQALQTSLEILNEGLKYSYEEKVSLNKKRNKIQRVIDIIDNINNFTYIEQAEAKLGNSFVSNIRFEPTENNLSVLINDVTTSQEEINNEILKVAYELEIAEWNELWDTLKGQDYSKFNDDKDWDEQFDGSGLQGWWN